MGGLRWIWSNWATVLNAVGIIGGLFFTAAAFRSEARSRRVANLLAITKNHRDIWADFYGKPELARILDASPNLKQQPVTLAEEVFVNLVILHTSSVFYVLKDNMMVRLEGLRRDVQLFFSLPIPLTVWQRLKGLQNQAFVDFVAQCRNAA